MTYKIGYFRFSAWFLGLTIGLPLLFMAIAYFSSFDLSSSASTVIPMMIASLQEGTHFARAEHRRPEGREAWGIAVRLTGVAMAITIVLTAILFLIQPELFAVLGFPGLVIILLVFALLFVVLGRLFLGLGARSHMKALEKQRAKSGPDA